MVGQPIFYHHAWTPCRTDSLRSFVCLLAMPKRICLLGSVPCGRTTSTSLLHLLVALVELKETPHSRHMVQREINRLPLIRFHLAVEAPSYFSGLASDGWLGT